MPPFSDISLESLSGCLVPSSPTDLTEQDEEAIESAIDAFDEICYGEGDSTLNELKEQFVQFWEVGILEWMLYLFNHYHPPDDMESRWLVISTVSYVLKLFIENHTELVTNDHRSLALGIQLWQVTDFDDKRWEYALTHGWWEPFLSMVHLKLVTTDDKEQQSYIDAAATIHLIISRLLCVNQPTSNQEYTLLFNALTKVLLLDNSTGSRLNSMICDLTDIFRWLVVVQLPNLTDNLFKDWMFTCLAMSFSITTKIKAANTIESLCAAIRHNLLEAIVKLSKHLKHAHELLEVTPAQAKNVMRKGGVINIIAEYLPQHIYYDSVLKAMKYSIQNDEYRKETEGTMAEEAWDGLSRMYESTMTILKSPSTPLISLCENPMYAMRVIRPPVKFYACMGCESAWYCSTKCQKSHWDKAHRKECTNLRALNASIHEGVKQRDCISVCRVTICLLRGSDEWNEAKAPAKRKFPRNKLSQLTIVMNHTKLPSVIDVVKRDRSAVIAALAAGPQATVIQCLVPVGSQVATITTAGDITKYDYKVWFAGRSLITYSPAPDAEP